MTSSYSENGVVFFNEPFKVKRVDWIYKHLDCDSIIVKSDFSNSEISVLCYASSEEYNNYLKELRDNKYPDCLLLRGIGHEEVNCID